MSRNWPRTKGVIDTSASKSNGDLSAAYSEARLLCRQIDRDNAVLVACDVEPVVIARGTFPESAPLIGGGGTDMGAALDLLALERRPPDVTVVLTDGAAPWPDTLPVRLRNSHVVVGHIAPGVDSTEFNWPAWCSVVKIGGC